MAAPVTTHPVLSTEPVVDEMDSFVRTDSPVHYRLRPPTPGRLASATWDGGIVVVGGLYAVTDGMRSAIEAAGLTGVAFGPLAVTRNPRMLDMSELPRLHTLVLTGRACRDDVAPWRCESLALSLRAARTLWGVDAALLPGTTVLDVIGLPD